MSGWGDPAKLKEVQKGAVGAGLAAPIPDKRTFGDKKAYDAWLAAQAPTFAREYAGDAASHHNKVIDKWRGRSGNQWQALHEKARVMGFLDADGNYTGPAEAAGGGGVPSSQGDERPEQWSDAGTTVDRMQAALQGLTL